MGLTRREFLKTSAVAGAAVGVVGLPAVASQRGDSTRTDTRTAMPAIGALSPLAAGARAPQQQAAPPAGLDRADLLKWELANDPLARGYSGMTDTQVLDSLTTVFDRQPPAGTTVEATEVLNRIVIAEYNLLLETQKDRLYALLAIGRLDPWGIEANILQGLFGGSSTTVQNLSAYRDTLLITRAQELGLGTLYEGNIIEARA